MKVLKVRKAIEGVTRETKLVPLDYECAHCGEMNHKSIQAYILKYLNRQGIDETDFSKYCTHCGGKNQIFVSTEVGVIE